MDAEKYRQISACREVNSFLQKAAGGRYQWEDIHRDTDNSGNVRIAGLPDKLCELLNSQESNGKYEQLRADIYLLWSARGWTEPCCEFYFHSKVQNPFRVWEVLFNNNKEHAEAE